MTTHELKQQIDKVLGNSIRCLLPSYWWKRLFNQVTDRIDEVEQSTSKLIESKVEEVKMPIVESVDELEKLNVEKGGVAAVEKVGEPVVVNYEDCYISTDYINDWDKYTIVRGVSEIGEVPLDVKEGGIDLIADKYGIELDTIVIGIEYGRRAYGKISGGRFSYLTLDKVNEYLASGRYRLCGGYLSDRIAQYFTFYSEKPQPSLYIKGDSWEKLSKEYVVSSEEELNALSVENGTIARVVREIEPQAVKVADCYLTNNTDNYASEWDKFTVIKKIEETDVNAESSNVLYICALNESFTKDAIGVGYDNGVRFYTRIVDGVERPVSLDIVNDLLATGNYRLVIWAIAGRFDSYFTFYTKVAKDVSDAYIKGETWTRLLKEGDVSGGESSGKVDRVIYGFNTDLTAEHVESNKETYRLFSEGKASITILAGGVFFFTPNRYYHYNDSFVFVFVYDAYQCGIILNEDGTVEYESDLIVDSELSDTSENPVQNKVVTSALNSKADISYVDSAIAEAITNTINTPV